MAPGTAGSASVSLQTREVRRYYQPWLSAHGSSLNVANHVDSIAQRDLHGQGYRPRASRDKALMAFAQLVALRLHVRRAMISLIDATSQYILAEATQSSSIATAQAKANDEIWLGSTVLSRRDAVCEHCFYNMCTATDEDGQTYTTKGLIVEDCRLDDRFKERPYVISEPGVRFYAGVPLFSRNGHMIGVCAVSNETPRAGLRVDELKLMQETGQSVMEHLEWARDRVDRFKGEHIVRGMASFIEGCTSLRDEPTHAEIAPETTPTGEAHVEKDRPSSPRPPLVSRPSARRLPSLYRVAEGQTAHARSKSAQKAGAVGKGDTLANMFARAADILRESTLADGAAIFGATATTGRASLIKPLVTLPDGSKGPAPLSSSAESPAPSPGSDSDRHETGTSDSESSPGSRPCKILAYSIADELARADIESGSALTLSTLEKYFHLFPQGRTFSFNDEGSGISSEDDNSASDVEAMSNTSPSSAKDESGHETARERRHRRRKMDHKELLKKIPGARSVVFLPLYDHSEEKLMAGCFLWTSVTGRMMTLDSDLSYLRAFANCIASEVVRVNMQRNEAAKTSFIASISHELRSPLHGILGAAEFLMDTANDAYQSGLITSISTCGKTLLDTLNHVLDYSKINKLGRAQMRRNNKSNKLVNLASDSTLESMNMTADLDLGILVEEVAEAVTAGHAFKKMPGSEAVSGIRPINNTSSSVNVLSHSEHSAPSNLSTTQMDDAVAVLLDISPRRSWMVRTQPGALRRIIMNLFGNALKYTSKGFVAVSLRAQESSNSNKINALIRVVDSGKGMSEAFQRDRLFVPFSQEDSFQPGTGLGLSIVKQIVDSLGGTMDVRSQQGIGTEIDVHLSLPKATESHIGPPDDELAAVGDKTRGKTLVLLDPSDPSKPRTHTHQISRLEATLRESCASWFGMNVVKSTLMDQQHADIYLYSEPPPVEHLVERHKHTGQGVLPSREVPVIMVYMSAEEAIAISRNQQKVLNELGSIVEVIPQPCGPRKLAKVLNHCLRRAEEARQQREANGDTPGPEPQASGVSDQSIQAENPLHPELRREATVNPDNLGKTMSAAVSYPSPPPINPATPSLLNKPSEPAPPTGQPSDTSQADLHVLLVDDNKINRQLLVMFMKKSKFSYAEAENGQEALDLYKSSCLPGPATTSTETTRRFDFVLMDISMPVMDGMESTKRIREFEKENGLQKTNVIALTGLASAQAQQEAVTVGVDVFLPKPVKFSELKKLLAASPEGAKNE